MSDTTLSQQVNDAMKDAMKARDTAALNVLRALKSAIKNTAIEKHGADSDLDDPEVMAVVRKQIKQRQDSLESFEKAGRDDLAATEKAEMEVLAKFLPAGLSESEIEAIVESAIAETGATSKKDMGQVMKLVQEKAAGRADGKALSQAVMKRLN